MFFRTLLVFFVALFQLQALLVLAVPLRTTPSSALTVIGNRDVNNVQPRAEGQAIGAIVKVAGKAIVKGFKKLGSVIKHSIEKTKEHKKEKKAAKAAAKVAKAAAATPTPTPTPAAG